MTRTTGWAIVMLSFTVMLIFGCAVGNKHAYEGVAVDMNATGSSPVAIATHDQRPYVISGDKQANFVGLQRGGFGNPFNVTTLSGNALAEDFSNTIAAALRAKGFQPIPVILTSTDAGETVKAHLMAKKAERFILLTIYEWKSDTYQNTALKYNVAIQVFDPDGKRLAEKTIVGEDDLKGSFMNPPGHAKKVIPQAFEEKLELLLNDSAVSGALQSSY